MSIRFGRDAYKYTSMEPATLQSALESVPAGRWAVGVSGGADSVGLLLLLRQRADLALHVVHLDHETRGAESAGDAGFVLELSRRWNLPCTLRRSELEPAMPELPANLSARYRAVRVALFKRVVRENNLAGVILAHHADDQAETVLHRLLRGSGFAGLGAMSPRTLLGELVVLRPLLGVRGAALREFLRRQNQPWREDASNVSSKYFRNRLRRVLTDQPTLGEELLRLAQACAALGRWTASSAPKLDATFPAAALTDLPPILAAESARRWLRERGVPAEELIPEVVQRLATMARDAASPARQHFPGRVLVRRQGGRFSRNSASPISLMRLQSSFRRRLQGDAFVATRRHVALQATAKRSR